MGSRETSRWRQRIATAVVAVALLGALWTLAIVQRGIAQSAAGCNPTCVVLIQVDGLEPRDVNPASTPYLWSLAHPPAQTPSGALSDRSGWIWQAPRSVMSTGTAPATASLLTGSYPEFSGIPADDFVNRPQRQRLGASGFGDFDATRQPPQSRDGAVQVDAPQVTTLVEEVGEIGGQAAVFLGDRALAQVAHATEGDTRAFWYPPGDDDSASRPQSQFTGDPHLCPLPRYPNDAAPGAQTPTPASCPANDMTTANKAASDLGVEPGVNFAFIHLAELGAAKRLYGNPHVDPENSPPHPSQALVNADSAIGAFAEQYAQSSPDRWDNTVLMVVGSHGYQTTPLERRVPSPVEPTPANPTPDLADYVAAFDPPGDDGPNSLSLVPQGTLATIYYQPHLQESAVDRGRRRSALDAIKADLQRTDDKGVNAACKKASQDPDPCIGEVLFLDAATPGTLDTVEARHPTWNLDVHGPEGDDPRTGAAGDLLVTLTRGWAAGRALGNPQSPATPTAQPLSNPNMASAGGPQERAVAALVNGPRQASVPGAVRNLGDAVRYYPVSKNRVDPSDANNPPPANDPRCPDAPPTDFGGLACANKPSVVGDDANDPGHEAQPESVDFANTISALLQLPFANPDQLQGRILQEAFLQTLKTPCVVGCEPQDPVEEDTFEEALPAPPVEVIAPKDPFTFRGLVQRLRARVVDSRNRTYSRAPAGAMLSRIRLEADFGKPRAAVTLTFYRATRRASSGRRGRGRTRVVRLRAIGRFDPFVVKRGHVRIRLKVPRQFRPTHVGLTVRQIVSGRSRGRCTKRKTQRPVRFRCAGPTAGVIVSVRDGAHLHKRKGRSLHKRQGRSKRRGGGDSAGRRM